MNSPKRLQLTLLALTAMLFSAVSQADDQYLFSDDDGFTYQLVQVEKHKLAVYMDRTHVALEQKLTHLQQRATELVFTKIDLLITAVMPGGLFYAAYRKVNIENNKYMLAKVDNDLDELLGDMMQLPEIYDPNTLIAMN